MASEETIETPLFNSSYRFGVDPKRRVQIPSKWRPETAGAQLTLILWPFSAGGACLRVLPRPQMVKLQRDIEAMPNGEEKSRLKRIIGRGSEQVTLDSAGRILLPEGLAQAAGITDKAVMVGLLDCFEIYCPERYAKVEEADAVAAPVAMKFVG